ncbi:helix-turn-helix domain-containing protein [Allokutzneria albata]|uniref:Helix-turn-helix domain-containing protein n=1 Tax=Allokutzneria albata TaxID=211114 RepID=A0A1H0DWK5_ALLAB|nr:helix-turn-helix domain-containing protein [Allokutzneria albata]SDN73145.1 hypothetical protein SAMN04489726_7972 [Allokutzneria albata]SDN74448.1 hypothetical protein SAMN04489726_8031 [Allokutzneria albata]
MSVESPWMTVAEVAAYSRHHFQTVLTALRTNELEGKQRAANCTWRVHRDAVDRWMSGEKPKPRRLRRAS